MNVAAAAGFADRRARDGQRLRTVRGRLTRKHDHAHGQNCGRTYPPHASHLIPPNPPERKFRRRGTDVTRMWFERKVSLQTYPTEGLSPRSPRRRFLHASPCSLPRTAVRTRVLTHYTKRGLVVAARGVRGGGCWRTNVVLLTAAALVAALSLRPARSRRGRDGRPGGRDNPTEPATAQDRAATPTRIRRATDETPRILDASGSRAAHWGRTRPTRLLTLQDPPPAEDPPVVTIEPEPPVVVTEPPGDPAETPEAGCPNETAERNSPRDLP